MSPKLSNGWLEGRLRFLLFFAAAIVAVVVFAWRSQANQNARIGRNETAVAVFETKLDGIAEKIDEVRDILRER